jgi:hypothetical protein
VKSLVVYSNIPSSYSNHLQRKGVHEVLEESKELGGSLFLIFRRAIATDMAETSTSGLFNPDDVGQVRPRPVVLHGQVGAVLPQERAVLLKETLKTGAAWSSVQPNQDLITGEFVCRWDEPEVQLGCIGLVRDGQQTGVRLANVEVNIGNRSTVNSKLGGVGVLGQDEGLVAAAVCRRGVTCVQRGLRTRLLKEMALVHVGWVARQGE